MDHQELARAILLFKASKGEALIQYDEQGAYVVWHEETDLYKYGDDDQRRILLKLLPRDFKFAAENNETGLRIRMTHTCARKIVFYKNNNHRNIVVYSKELINIGRFVMAIPYIKTKRFDVDRVLLFSSRIKIGTEMFSVQLNIFDSNAGGYQLYDINKITQISDNELEARADSGSNSFINNC